jgi:hypothetical protein
VSKRVIQTPMRTPESYEHSATGPFGRVGQVSEVVDGIVFPESSPTSRARSSNIDGGQIAGR